MGRRICPFNAKNGWMTTFLCHLELIQKWQIRQLTFDIPWTCISSPALVCCIIGLSVDLVHVLQFVISYYWLLSQSRKLSKWLIEFFLSYLFVYWFPSKILIQYSSKYSLNSITSSWEGEGGMTMWTSWMNLPIFCY